MDTLTMLLSATFVLLSQSNNPMEHYGASCPVDSVDWIHCGYAGETCTIPSSVSYGYISQCVQEITQGEKGNLCNLEYFVNTNKDPWKFDCEPFYENFFVKKYDAAMCCYKPIIPTNKKMRMGLLWNGNGPFGDNSWNNAKIEENNAKIEENTAKRYSSTQRMAMVYGANAFFFRIFQGYMKCQSNFRREAQYFDDPSPGDTKSCYVSNSESVLPREFSYITDANFTLCAAFNPPPYSKSNRPARCTGFTSTIPTWVRFGYPEYNIWFYRYIYSTHGSIIC
eukprot:287758_1